MKKANSVKCPAEGCPHDIPATQGFCRFHWLSLPKDLRRTILKAQSDDRKLWVDSMKQAQEMLKRLDQGIAV